MFQINTQPRLRCWENFQNRDSEPISKVIIPDFIELSNPNCSVQRWVHQEVIMESDGPPVFHDDEPMADLTEACSEKYPESEYPEAAEAGSTFEPESTNGQSHPHEEQEGEGAEAGDGKILEFVFVVIG